MWKLKTYFPMNREWSRKKEDVGVKDYKPTGENV